MEFLKFLQFLFFSKSIDELTKKCNFAVLFEDDRKKKSISLARCAVTSGNGFRKCLTRVKVFNFRSRKSCARMKVSKKKWANFFDSCIERSRLREENRFFKTSCASFDFIFLIKGRVIYELWMTFIVIREIHI